MEGAWSARGSRGDRRVVGARRCRWKGRDRREAAAVEGAGIDGAFLAGQVRAFTGACAGTAVAALARGEWDAVVDTWSAEGAASRGAG